MIRLRRQRLLDALGVGMPFGVDIVNDRDARRVDRDSRERFAQPLRRRSHQRRVEWSAHRQRDRPLRAARLRGLDRPLHRARVAGDDDLPRGIEVYRLADLAPCGFRAHRADRLVVQTQDRSHCAHSLRHRFLHRPAAQANQRDAIGK